MASKKRSGIAPTVEQIQSDIITQLSSQYWAPFSNVPRLPYCSQIVEDIYKKELLKTQFATRRVMLLEFSQYLENYLWPNYSNKASKAHVMSIVTMINEKYRERVPAWECFRTRPDIFPTFFHQVMEISLDELNSSYSEQTIMVIFLIHCCNSLGNDLVRKQFLRLVSLLTWSNLLPSRRNELFERFLPYKKAWKKLNHMDSKLDDAARKVADLEKNFFARHVQKYFRVLYSIPEKGKVPEEGIHYCERFLELLIDLEAQLPTRRFFNTLLDDSHVVVRSRLSALARRDDGKLFTQLLEMLQFFSGFEISDQVGEALTDRDMTIMHYDRIGSLQKAVFKHFPDLHRFALANIASIDTRESLMKHFSPLSNRKLHELAAYLNLVSPPSDDKQDEFPSEFLLELLVSLHERRPSQLEALNDMPLYPTEEIIWNENVVPMEYFGGTDSKQGVSGGLALSKLNLQFLTIHDYLLRNFHLFRLESTYEIRQDIEDAITRMKPWKAEDGSCYFGGWARMAHPIVSFSVVEVSKPNIGENHPARVRADVTVNLNLRPEIKREWESLRKHDVAFLITVRPPHTIGRRYDFHEPFMPQVGLAYVRGCEIEGMLDENGRVIEEGPDPKPILKGDSRTYRVFLDPNQYQRDMTEIVKDHEDPYETFNVILRRKPKENNFKAVLETIRDLMNTECVVPDWLINIILGYGDPDAAHYSKMANGIATLDWNDTFLNLDHLKASFPGYKVVVKKSPTAPQPIPPYRITFLVVDQKENESKKKKVPTATLR